MFLSRNTPSFSLSIKHYTALFYIGIVTSLSFIGDVYAKADISVTSNYYEFEAKDKVSIWEGIISRSPKISLDDHAQHNAIVGLTEWSLRYKYTFQAALYRCEIKEFNISADIAVHLPHWEDKWKASLVLQKSWDNYVRMVSDHEDIHKIYAIRTADRIDKDVLAIGQRKRCEELESEVEAIFKRHLLQNRLDNTWFDAKEKIHQKNAIWF